jgi:hypothetical protein
MRARILVTGLAVSSLVSLVVLGAASPASAAPDHTGPNIVMQRTGHFVVGAPVTCTSACAFDANQYQVFNTVAQVRWSGSDPSGVCDYQVWDDSGRTYASLLADVGKATTYNLRTGDIDEADGGYDYLSIEIRAKDCAGNWSISGDADIENEAPTDRVLGLPDNFNAATSFDDSAATYTGAGSTWTHSTGTAFMGGSDIHAVKAGASFTFKYSAQQAFAWVSEYGPGRGSAKVYQDGVLKGTVNLNKAANTGPEVVWANWFPTAGNHVIKVVVVGTAAHPRIDVDGFFTGPCIC